MFQRFLLFIHFLLSLSVTSGQSILDDWATFCEKSGHTETPRYAETVEYCMKLDKASPQISFNYFGASKQGRGLPLLILDKDGLAKPEDAKAAGKVVLLVQACIHAGESEGKDAGLALFRDLAIRKIPINFDSITILLMPIFNTDGHERFTPYSRINQNGPKEAGWRTTADNLNLNRDYLKAETPEMQAWLKLFNQWEPDFFIDCHTTDGADYQYPLTIECDGYAPEFLRGWNRDVFEKTLRDSLERNGFPAFGYVTFRNWHDPRSGLIDEMGTPRFSQAYAIARHCPAMLIETHMLKSYETRVQVTYEALKHAIEILQQQKAGLKDIISQASRFDASEAFRKEPCVLEYEISTTDSNMVIFKGFEYTAEKSDLTGGIWFRYSDVPKDFLIPMFDTRVPSVSVSLPEAYIVPLEHAWLCEKLELHGVQYTILKTDIEIDVLLYKLSNPVWDKTPYEGCQVLDQVIIQEYREKRNYMKGSAIIDMNQPGARLVAYLLEPATSESLVRWGYFNSIFEQKEYAESYVMEKVAREMLASDPGLKKEFEAKKQSDKSFAANQRAQLDWFYQKTPWFDQQLGVYPVSRINSRDYLTTILRNNPK